mgnify:CR=1 FL=1
MENIQELREQILLSSNTAQEKLEDILENSNKNIKELYVNISLDGDLDFSILETMGFGLIDTIRLGKGSITSFKNLPSKLKSLIVEDNLIFEVFDLPKSIEELNIQNNFLKKIEVSHLKELKKLYLDSNRLEVLGPISDTVEELSVTYNKLPSLNLQGLSNLKILNVSENPIHIIEGLPENIIDFKYENTPSIEFRNFDADLQPFITEEEVEQLKKEKELKKDYIEALNTYFELKAKYEKNEYELKKKAFLKQNTKKARRSAVKMVVAPCIKCKRYVGSLFYKKENNYIAICGDKKNPCDLNIKLFDGKTYSLEESYELTKENYDEDKENIIKHKLNTLFGFIDEEKSSDMYKTYMEEYNLLSKFYNDLIKKYDNIYFSPVREEKVQTKNQKVFEHLEDIKRILNEYKETHNEELIRDAVTIHIENILPELRNIRHLQNEVNEMEIDYDKKVSKVFKYPVSLHELQDNFSIPRVESFIPTSLLYK